MGTPYWECQENRLRQPADANRPPRGGHPVGSDRRVRGGRFRRFQDHFEGIQEPVEAIRNATETATAVTGVRFFRVDLVYT